MRCVSSSAGWAQGWDLAGQVGDRVGSRCLVFEVGICWVSLTEVGHLFERDRTTVAHACGLVEDRRDDPDFDYRLNHLERAVSCLLGGLSMRQGRG